MNLSWLVAGAGGVVVILAFVARRIRFRVGKRQAIQCPAREERAWAQLVWDSRSGRYSGVARCSASAEDHSIRCRLACVDEMNSGSQAAPPMSPPADGAA